MSPDLPPSLAFNAPHVLGFRYLLDFRTACALTSAAAIYVCTHKNVSTHTAVARGNYGFGIT